MQIDQATVQLAQLELFSFNKKHNYFVWHITKTRKITTDQDLVEITYDTMMDVNKKYLVVVTSVGVDTTQATDCNVVKLSEEVEDYKNEVMLMNNQLEYQND